jgi:ketosteroid isomerase-like protein
MWKNQVDEQWGNNDTAAGDGAMESSFVDAGVDGVAVAVWGHGDVMTVTTTNVVAAAQTVTHVRDYRVYMD